MAMGVDYERSFRLDVIDHDKELVFRGELPGVEINGIAAKVMSDRLMIEVERMFKVAERHTMKVA
jgi:HSP20 family molecular chaperone IbpA